jgi:hypothetical protein
MALLFVAAATACAWAQEAMVVKLEPGVTRLAEIGAYRVGYERRGEPVVMMSEGWVGHFEERSGVSYTPWVRQDGRDSILLHCPWRGGTGISFVEYDLELPAVRPIAFDFAIAMQEGMTEQSDGATFRASIRAEGESLTLCDEHRKSTEWKEFAADLSRWSGRRLTLRLEIGPGPDDNPGWDYSLWGDPRITAGAPSPQDAVRAALRARERWRKALKDTDLVALTNRSDVGCRPTCDDKYQNAVRREGEACVFEYRGSDLRMSYRLGGDADPGELTVQVEDLPPFQVARGFGPEGGAWKWRLEETRIAGGAPPAAGELVLRGRYELADATVPARVSLRIEGKTLVIGVEAAAGVEAFSLGSLGPVALRRVVSVPYLYAGEIRYLPHDGLFYSAVLDWVETNASSHAGTTARYEELATGSRNAVREVGYITVSPDLREVLPNIPLAPSPYLKQLAPRVMLDIWGGTFAQNAETLRDLADYGVTDAAIIAHVWQRGGYDNEYPTVLPANAGLGGDEGLREFSRAAAQAGHVFSLHENYVDFYPNSELYDEADVARNQRGELQKGWFNAATGEQSYALKPARFLKYARQFSPEIHRRYDTTAAYLDVHTCAPPWFRVDFDAAEPGAGTSRRCYDNNLALFRLERETHGGPLFGEGCQQMYWAGAVDGVEAQIAGGEGAPLLLDFDLLKLHPQMVNHGMGYHERWLQESYDGDWGQRMPAQYRMDKYRSMEIAYGHAGFIANQILREPSYAVKEHHLVAPVQALYGAAKAVDIRYEVDGRMVDVSDAVAAGALDRAYVRYDSGLEVWVNHREQDWRVGDHAIPQHCFLARGPGLLAYSGRRGGPFCDYAETPQSIYADARSVVVAPWRDITPRVASFEALGGRRFRFTYEWRAGEPLDEDCHVFVHFTDSGPREGIVFQQDHEPSLATSQWPVGQVVRDGPYEIEAPESAGDHFAWTIGLYRTTRVSLRGKLDQSGRVILGEIEIGPDGVASFSPTDEGEVSEMAAGYERRMNPAREAVRRLRMVDFGKVATNGAVFVRRRKDELEVIPIPRGRPLTVALRLRELGLDWRAAEVSALGADGRRLSRRQAEVVDGLITMQAGEAGARSYVVKGTAAQ